MEGKVFFNLDVLPVRSVSFLFNLFLTLLLIYQILVFYLKMLISCRL